MTILEKSFFSTRFSNNKDLTIGRYSAGHILIHFFLILRGELES